ncbi:MAG: PadR family transcriptional regulator [bacterium]|nr:PadR family transcriptional regulator [bacterium]
MSENRLGELEEVLMLIVGILEEKAYALNITEEYEAQADRKVAIGAVHTTLNRLEKKGFLTSEMGGATAERGGRRKRIYSITASGHRALANVRDFRLTLWKQFPAFAEGKLKFVLA